jgi:lipopolysaccharide/colanic/teichoic acid biosynthesis glycosyltransferase
LDELPQFWCVLKGDMSLVGPRPEMAELVAKFCESVHSYGLRFRMKPGMTGWAAIHGFRGNTSLQERIDYDMYYIQNWSWLGDLKILVVTLFRLKSTI